MRRLGPLALILLVVTACGSSATNDYRGQVASVQKKYEQQLTDLTTKATTDLAGDQAAAQKDLADLAAAVNAFADEVAAIQPPSDKQALADQLVQAYRTLAKAATDLKTAVAHQDQAALKTALGEFTAATSAESTAVDAFNASG